MGLYQHHLKNRNTYLRWMIKLMNRMGIFDSYQFNERGLYRM